MSELFAQPCSYGGKHAQTVLGAHFVPNRVQTQKLACENSSEDAHMLWHHGAAYDGPQQPRLIRLRVRPPQELPGASPCQPGCAASPPEAAECALKPSTPLCRGRRHGMGPNCIKNQL